MELDLSTLDDSSPYPCDLFGHRWVDQTGKRMRGWPSYRDPEMVCSHCGAVFLECYRATIASHER
jgi:hypothetical protein